MISFVFDKMEPNELTHQLTLSLISFVVEVLFQHRDRLPLVTSIETKGLASTQRTGQWKNALAIAITITVF